VGDGPLKKELKTFTIEFGMRRRRLDGLFSIDAAMEKLYALYEHR